MVETEFELGGFQISISEHADQYGAPDHLGRFTETWEEGAISHHGKSRYGGRGEPKWYIPEESVESIRKYYSSVGYSKQQAEEMARYQIEQDYQRADAFGHEWHYNTVVATASRCGVTLGEACMGGVESDADDGYLQEVVDELAEEAVATAKEKLDELLATISPLKQLALCTED
jgi:hypothetical protein